MFRYRFSDYFAYAKSGRKARIRILKYHLYSGTDFAKLGVFHFSEILAVEQHFSVGYGMQS